MVITDKPSVVPPCCPTPTHPARQAQVSHVPFPGRYPLQPPWRFQGARAPRGRGWRLHFIRTETQPRRRRAEASPSCRSPEPDALQWSGDY